MAEEEDVGVDAGDRSRARSVPIWWVPIGVVLGAALVGAFLLVSGDEAGAGEVFLEPIGVAGPDPFTESVAAVASGSLADFAIRDDPTPRPAPPAYLVPASTPAASRAESLGYTVVAGTEPRLFGGVLGAASCEQPRLVDLLRSEPDKATAWASVLDIDVDEIATFVASLTSVVLTEDTRVLNHGYTNGAAAPRESVLQRGTAVLVDSRGEPRIRCTSGSPLLPPDPDDLASPGDTSYVGQPWAGFDPASPQVIAGAVDLVEVFALLDYETGGEFERPAGTTGADDEPVPTTGDADVTGTTSTQPAPDPEPATTQVPETSAAPAPTAVNPFDDPDEVMADLPLPDDLPDGAGTFDRPRPGTWTVNNLGGTIECTDFGTFPLPVSTAAGVIEVTDDGDSLDIVADDGNTIQATRVDDLIGRYEGSGVIVTDEAVDYTITIQVVTEDLMVARSVGTGLADGQTCTVEFDLQIIFVGPPPG